MKQVLRTDIAGDEQYKGKTDFRWEKGGTLPKYNNYGAGSSDPGGFIVEGKNALGIGTYTQVRGDSAIGLATGEMTADLSLKDKSEYAKAMSQIMGMEEILYEAKEELEKLKAETGDTAKAESAMKAAEERLATAKKEFREKYLSKYSFVEGEAALGVGRKILAQGDRSMAVGDQAKAISNDAIAYGGNTLANGTNSMAMGGSAHVGTEKDAFANSMAIGSHTNVQAGNAVALGAFSEVTGTNSLALGFGTQSSTDSNNITYNSVSGHDSTLIGSYGNIAGNNSILIGSSGSIANDRVVGLGNNINIEAADQNDQENNTAGSVFLGDHAGYVKDSKRSRSLGEVTLVGSKEKKELTESLSSTKGALRDYTKDFIYIYMLENQDDGTKIGAPIAVRSDFAGGNSTVGVVSVGSTYEQTFENLDKIKEHHKKVGSLITVPVEVTVQVTKNGVPLGKQQQTRYFAADATQEQIYSDNTLLSDEDKKKVWNTIQESLKKTDTKYTVFETRRIQNVAPGLIGVNSTDAINGSQLFATNQMLGNLVGSLKKTFGDNVTITEDGQIKVSGEGTLGWIAKAKVADSSNGTVDYQVGKDDKITKDNLKEKGSAIEAADQLVFQAGKNIGLVQTPDTLTISTIDTPSFTSVTTGSGDNTTVMNQDGVTIKAKTGNTDGTKTDHKTSITKDGLATDGTVKVTNGKDGNQAKDLVTIGKNVDPNAPAGTDGENGTIGLDGKNGSSATITVDRGTSSLDDTKNIGGTDPKQDISKDNPAKMDRITYTTKNKDDKDVITHEVATMDDGLFLSGDSADGKDGNVKNKFDRKLSQETKIIGGVNLGLTDNASTEDRKKAIAAKLTDGNIGVISDGTDTLTVKLAKQLTDLDSTTYTSLTTKTDDGNATSTMKVDGNGVRFVGDNNTVKNDAPSLTTDGITGGGKQITNIDSGLKNGNKTISISDLKDPNKTETINSILNNAVNVSDLKNLVDTGFKLNTSGQPTNSGASTVKIGETINVINGVNTKVSAIDDTVEGTHTFHIDVTGMPISYTDNQGNALTKIGDKYYKNTDIENGKPKTNATEVLADEVTNNIKVINKDGTTNNQGTISNVKSVFDSNIGNGADTGSKIDEIKDGSVISNTGSNQFINDLTKLNDQVDPKATDTEAEKIRAKKDEEKLNSVSTVRDLQKVALTPLFFEGDVAQDEKTANTFDRKLSEKTKIVGGQKDVTQLTDSNIGVVSNGTDTLTIKLAKELQNLTSVTTGSDDNTTVMNQDGVTIKAKTDNTDGTKTDHKTSLTKDGLATDGTIKVTGDNAKDLVTIAKGTETDQNATDKEFGTVAIDGKNGSKATLTVDRGTKSVTDSANVGKDPTKPIDKDNPAAGMDRLTYTTTTGIGDKTIEIEHQVATLDDGFFLTTEHTGEDKTRTVLFNNTIKVLDGANTKVSAMGGEDGTHTFSIDVTGLPVSYTVQQDGNTTPENVSKVGDTYQLANGTKLVKVGDKFYKPDQLVNPTVENPTVKQGEENKDWKLTNNVSLVNPNDGKDAPTLSNVGSALKKSDGTRITMSDLDDSSTYPTDNPIWNNAVNVGDLKAATDAARTEVTGTGKAIVTKKTGDKGKNIYNVHVDPVVDVVATDGKTPVVRGDDGKYYNPTDIANKTFVPDGKGGGSWYNNNDLTDGKPKPDAKPQTIKTANIKNKMVNPNGGDSIVLDNIKSGIGGKVEDPDKNNANTFLENVNKIGKKDGDQPAADAISENVVVNAKDLKNVVDTGFKLNTSGHSGDAQTVKIGETIKVVDGANTKVSDITPKDGVYEFHIDVTGLPMTYTVSQTGGTDAPVSVSKVGDTYQLADGTKLVKVGNKFYKPSQLVDPKAKQPEVKPEEVNKNWTVNDSISLVNKDGSNNAPTLKNVGSGLKDANGNATTLDKADGSNAVNVDDLRTLGKAATTEVKGTGAAEVTKVTGANGQNVYNVHVERFMQVAETDVEGNKVVKAADNHYYKEADIKGKTYIDGQWYNDTDIKDKTKIGDKWYSNTEITDGKANPGATELTVQATTAPNKAVGLQNNLVNPNDNTPTRLSNLASALSGEVGNGANTEDESGSNTFVKNVLDLDATVKTEEQLKTSLGHDPSEDEVKAEKARAEKDKALLNSAVTVADLQKTLQSPLFFEGDSADGVANENGSDKNTFARKLSQKTKIVGGVDLGLKENATADERNKAIAEKLSDNNIGVVSNGTDTLTIKLAKNLVNLTSVETGSGNNKTKMTENGITTTVKDGDTFKVTTTTPNGLATTEVKLDSDDKPTGESTTTMVTTDGVTITTQTPPDPDGDKPASTTETKLSKDGLATDGTIKVTGDNAKDLVTIAKGTETDPNATDKEFGTVTIDGKNGSNATLTVDRGTKSVTDSANVGKDPTKPIDEDNPVAGMDRLTYTTTGPNNETINHEVATLDDGFMLTTSTDVANSKAPANVKLNNTIKFTDGANTKVSTVTSKDGVHELHVDVTGLPVTYTASVVDDQGNPTNTQNVSKVGNTYQLADGTKLVKSGDKYYKPDQLDNGQPKAGEKGLTIDNSIRVINPEQPNSTAKITNVAPGEADTDAVNMSQLKQKAAAATTEVTGTGAAEVTKVTGANGQNIYNVHVDKLMTVKAVDSATQVARGGDGKYYNADDIAGKTFVPSENKWYNTADVDATTGKPLEGKSALANQPLALDQSKLKNSVVNPNGDDATIVDNVKSGIGGEVKDTSGKNTFIKKLEKVGGTGEGAIDKTTVVNAGDLKNLADTPLFFSGDVSSATGTNNTFSRKLSEKVSIVGEVKHGLADTASAEDKANAIRAKLSDGNIGVISNGTDTLTIKLAKDLTGLNSSVYTSLTPAGNDGDATSSMKLDGNGIRFIDGQGNTKTDAPSLTTDGIKGGNKQITNIGSGLRDRQGKPVTLKNASEDILNNAVNVRDLRDVVQGLTDSGKGGGFGLTGNNGEVHKSLGETITLKGGIANKIENGIDMNKPEKATTDKNTYIDVKTSKNGSEKIMVVEIAKDLTDLNSAEFTDQEGNTTKMKGDGIYIDKNGDGNADISLTSEGLNNGGNKITNVADGTEDTDAVNVSQLNKLKQEIKQNIGDEINELNAYAPVVYSDKDGNRVIRKGNKFVKKNDETVEILPQDIRLSLVNADGKTTNPSTLQNVAEGVQDTDAVNVKQLKEATEKPLTFNGDAGSSSAKLGETVAIKGGANSADLTDNNIGVIANSSTKTLNVKLSKKLKGLESAEFVDNNGNTTNITGDGVHISGGNGSNVSLTSQGLNNGGNRITNVAPGVEATDAVNVSQLNQVGAALHNRINNVAKGAYGGVASAGAMASLPQAYLPGKSMVAAGASHYRGESAVALGASRISDNGKIILKLNASHNTSGNTMVGAGVGYQF
ncbi:YadA-like family protein [Gallibacterium anatis]|uniref:YadA-like family protein n=1 Tax=Gallibacterium anatis TaxID=750 RepID=UPI00254C3794|nr:YadA-like family protein [Gallibacterium anatis]MDK9560581.1 YadA-like family protein [Gallibacterium anatis]